MTQVVVGKGHAVVRPFYNDEAVKPNRCYLVGEDVFENYIYGEHSEDALISEYGEVLIFTFEPAVVTETLTDTVAGYILDKARFSPDMGVLMVPPHCGLEMWDVVGVTDTVCNLTNKKYRVKGWQMVYDNTQKMTTFMQAIRLTDV
jgi:hypothetical protein